MSVYIKQFLPRLSLISIVSEFEEDVSYPVGQTRHLNFFIWSSAPFELLEIYYCFASFFSNNINKSIGYFEIDPIDDSDKIMVLRPAFSKTFNHPWTILPEMMLGMTPNAIEQAQKLYANHTMQFEISIQNSSIVPFTENTRWHLIFRAITAQQFKVTVTQSLT